LHILKVSQYLRLTALEGGLRNPPSEPRAEASSDLKEREDVKGEMVRKRDNEPRSNMCISLKHKPNSYQRT